MEEKVMSYPFTLVTRLNRCYPKLYWVLSVLVNISLTWEGPGKKILRDMTGSSDSTVKILESPQIFLEHLAHYKAPLRIHINFKM